jgi:succinate dehydrogenase / fumarate reductase iron-sulfur subunit
VRSEIRLRIKRQTAPNGKPYWEEFRLDYRPKMNVISSLMEIQRHPVNAAGQAVAPIAWDCNCLEEVCGACAMVICGKARPACSALIDQLPPVVTLAPLSKFPVVRDLVVNRDAMFGHLRKVRAWISVDGTHDIGPGPRLPEKVRRAAYELNRCMTCGCCLEACPQVTGNNEFMGAAAIAQVALMNAHPTGAQEAEERLQTLMGPGGIAECGKAQNCDRACPKDLPLVTSIATVNRQMLRYAVVDWLKR